MGQGKFSSELENVYLQHTHKFTAIYIFTIKGLKIEIVIMDAVTKASSQLTTTHNAFDFKAVGQLMRRGGYAGISLYFGLHKPATSPQRRPAMFFFVLPFSLSASAQVTDPSSCHAH